jgi:hypothetical protein
VGKQLNITHSEYVFVVLGTQLAMRMRRIVICGLSGSKHYSALSKKSSTNFGFSLQSLSEKLLILIRTERHMVKNE